MSDFRLPVNARVKLRESAHAMYPFAVPGAEGFVRDRKMDDDGFPLVYIEWDKDHWAYEGERDTLTFEDHFDLIEPEEEPMADNNEDLLHQMYTILANHFEAKNGAKSHGEEKEVDLSSVAKRRSFNPDDIDDFMQTLSDAFESASEGEAFLVVAVSRQPHPAKNGETVLMPEIFKFARNDTARLLLGMQVAEIAAAEHQEANMQLLEIKDRDEPGR